MDTSFYILPARWMKHPFFCNMVWRNWVFCSPYFKTPKWPHLQKSNDQEGCPRTGGCMNTYRDWVTGEQLIGWKQSVAMKYCYPSTRPQCHNTKDNNKNLHHSENPHCHIHVLNSIISWCTRLIN